MVRVLCRRTPSTPVTGNQGAPDTGVPGRSPRCRKSHQPNSEYRLFRLNVHGRGAHTGDPYLRTPICWRRRLSAPPASPGVKLHPRAPSLPVARDSRVAYSPGEPSLLCVDLPVPVGVLRPSPGAVLATGVVCPLPPCLLAGARRDPASAVLLGYPSSDSLPPAAPRTWASAMAVRTLSMVWTCGVVAVTKPCTKTRKGISPSKDSAW